jgi:Tfp pilus assembly protein PilN
MIASVVLGLLFFVGIRQQAAIGDIQFLKSMIPHVAGQQAEIDRMNAMLAGLGEK